MAVELQNCLLIIDDLKGRKLAQQLGLTITGTIGVLVDAKISGIIPSIKPILLKIRATDFRITDALEQIILKRLGNNFTVSCGFLKGTGKVRFFRDRHLYFY